MLKCASQRLPLLAVCLLALYCASRRPQGSADFSKLDLVLREAIERGADEPLPVIVSAVPGHFTTLRGQLARRGAAIHADHPLIDAFSARIDRRELALLSL